MGQLLVRLSVQGGVLVLGGDVLAEGGVGGGSGGQWSGVLTEGAM